jgi:hypothetical protein
MANELSHWEIARASKTQGVVVSLTIDPKLISPRIRNKLVRWLKQGTLEGGYRSEARKLGDLLAKAFDLDMSCYYRNSLSVVDASPELCDELLELRKADWSAFAMENGVHRWVHSRLRENIHMLEMRRSSFTLYFQTTSLRRLAVQAIQKHLTDEKKQRIQRVIDAINGEAPILVGGSFQDDEPEPPTRNRSN